LTNGIIDGRGTSEYPLLRFFGGQKAFLGRSVGETVGEIEIKCEYCLDTGKYFGWLDDDYILIDCSCGHAENPIKSSEDPRWEEFNRRWEEK
jgi:hypothetical protein